MQSQQCSRVDLGDLKARIVKAIGDERSKRYFFYLNKYLVKKLSKSDFYKFCYRVFGREDLSLHNQFIRSILKNACQAKAPPSFHEVGPAKSAKTKSSPSRDDGHKPSMSVAPDQNLSVPIWSNGILPVSPRKGRSGRKLMKCFPQNQPKSKGINDSGSKVVTENGELTPCDYQRPVQHLRTVAEQPEANHFHILKDPLSAPLGIPFCSASTGGAHKALPVASCGDYVSYDNGGLSDTDTLRKHMEQIAVSQGIGGVSMESANVLNNMLDVYLKRLIRSCVDLVEHRKHHLQNKVINGMWPSNHFHMETMTPISVIDFKVAMELNPQHLGGDWPLLLEKINMHAFED